MVDTLVEVTCRRDDQVLTIRLVDTLGQDIRIEDDVAQLFEGRLGTFSQLAEPLRRHHEAFLRLEEVLTELRPHLLTPVVMIYTVGEPHPLEIHLKRFEVCRCSVTFI